MRRLALVVLLVVLPITGAVVLALNDDSGSGDDDQRTDSPALANGRQVDLQVGSARVKATVAATAKARERGLSGRASLPQVEGMLFVFPVRATPSFWMKGMRFPLDLVWIDEGKVVHTSERVPPAPRGQPDSRLPLYSPPVPVTQVLEVNAGWADRNEVRRGDIVSAGQ